MITEDYYRIVESENAIFSHQKHHMQNIVTSRQPERGFRLTVLKLLKTSFDR